MIKKIPHTFHIPVMGTGFTIDTPLKVARYGISSVISLVDDMLIEQMRKFHCEQNNEPYEEIKTKSEDSRARRITAYLNLLDKLVKKQVEALKKTPFEPGTEITRYFEMLPEGELKQTYRAMLACDDPAKRKMLQAELREAVQPGNIDVNIMTKLDRDIYRGKEKLDPELSDAQSALRGYAQSTLDSAIIFSAGINQRLYSYMAQFKDFFPTAGGHIKKQVILKVSDYRSAIIQGKFMAKRGLWVSEYRVESGLNCGGHAFASDGYLLGPILDEFKQNMETLIQKIYPIYAETLEKIKGTTLPDAPETRLTVQGGIGTAYEDRFLREHYHVSGTGWGTPFLLVPEATNVDPAHMDKLAKATGRDVYLSDSSPLGIPFWNLRNSESEDERRRRIESGKPGSPCPKGHLVNNTEFTDIPICRASRAYQKRKLEALSTEELTPAARSKAEYMVLAKSCICHDLAGVATITHNIDPVATSAVCCGPNIVNFSKRASLEEMVAHIYGRRSLLMTPERPHMFIRELNLYIDYLKKEIEQYTLNLSDRKPAYFVTFKENLLDGIEYYRNLGEHYIEERKDKFLNDLSALQAELQQITRTLPAAQLS